MLSLSLCLYRGSLARSRPVQFLSVQVHSRSRSSYTMQAKLERPVDSNDEHARRRAGQLNAAAAAAAEAARVLYGDTQTLKQQAE